MSLRNFFYVLLFTTPMTLLQAMDQSETFESIFNHLSDRMYCIAELNANKNNDIEKELEIATEKVKKIFNTQQITPAKNQPDFFMAVATGNKSIIKLFLDAKFDVNSHNESKQTPAMMAAYTGNVEVLQTLVEHGADLTCKDIRNETAKDWAEFVPKNFNKDINHTFALLPKFVSACARYKREDPFAACKKIIERNEVMLMDQMD